MINKHLFHLSDLKSVKHKSHKLFFTALSTAFISLSVFNISTNRNNLFNSSTVQASSHSKSDFKSDKKDTTDLAFQSGVNIQTGFKSDMYKNKNKQDNAGINVNMTVSKSVINKINSNKNSYKIYFTALNSDKDIIGKDSLLLDNSDNYTISFPVRKRRLKNSKYLFLKSVIVKNSKNVVCRKQSKVTLPTKQINSELNSDNKTGKIIRLLGQCRYYCLRRDNCYYI